MNNHSYPVINLFFPNNCYHVTQIQFSFMTMTLMVVHDNTAVSVITH